jgi:thiamine biosynthesis lipoprotein
MMQRRQVLRWGCGLLGAIAVGNALAKETRSTFVSKSDKLIWRERALIGFGTTLWIKAAHDNADQLEQALAAAVQVIRGIERQMSLFDPESEISRLNRFGTLKKPDADLLAVLKIAEHIARQSQGAFDASMQPLWDIWSKAALQKSQPSSLQIQRARKLVNWRAVHVTPDAVNLQIAGMGLSLNGIAQGYAADRLRATLQAHGVHHAMIDAGETALLGNAPNDKPWNISIESAATLKNSGGKNSLQPALIAQGVAAPIIISDGRAMATSSDAHTTFSQDHRYHHILNPHTGYSPSQWSSVTVLASSCVVADALTKVFFMTPNDQVLAKASRWGVDVVMQDKAGNWLASSGAPLRGMMG